MNIDDLKNLHTQGLCAVVGWNIGSGYTTGGFTFPYYVKQIRDGHRITPPIFFPYSDLSKDMAANNAAYVGFTIDSPTYAPEWAYLRSTGIPICLRHNNLAAGLTGPHNRLPKPWTRDTVDKSPLGWGVKKDAAGNDVYDDLAFADTWADPKFWAIEGKLLAESLYCKALQRQYPNPSTVYLWENHEAGLESYFHYSVEGPRAWPEPWYRFTWKKPDEVKALSLRMYEHVAPGGFSNDPWKEYGPFFKSREAQYRACFTAFRESLTPAWGENFYTGSYSATPEGPFPPFVTEQIGPCPDAMPFDSFGPEMYIGNYMPKDFTDPGMLNKATSNIPAWEFHRSKNPRAFREVFLKLTGAPALAGWKAGRHEPITPERWEAYCAWTLWMSRADNGGVPVVLHHFIESSFAPTTKFFALADGGAFDGAAQATHGDYFQPLMLAVDRICEQPIIREFWRFGTTIKPLQCSANTSTTIKVWSIAIRLDNQVLIYAWTPCKLDSAIVTIPDQGDFEIKFNGEPAVYYLGKPTKGLVWQRL